MAELNVTQAMQDQDYSAVYMTELAEDFFVSLGMPALPESFWQRSLLVKPRDREVVCHASAWSIDASDDVRDQDVHRAHPGPPVHDLPRTGPHLLLPRLQGSADHLPVRGPRRVSRGVGDTVTLSMTGDFLKNLGLVEKVEDSPEALINSQMKLALDKIAFLPFGS